MSNVGARIYLNSEERGRLHFGRLIPLFIRKIKGTLN